MNVVILQGNLTNHPNLRYIDTTRGRVAVCSFAIATHRYYKTANGEKNKETTFIDCELWDSGAEIISKYVAKGDSLLVRGSLKNDSWEKDGQVIKKTRLRVEEFELQPKRTKNNNGVDHTNTVNDDLSNVTTESESNQVTDTQEAKFNGNGDDIPF